MRHTIVVNRYAAVVLLKGEVLSRHPNQEIARASLGADGFDAKVIDARPRSMQGQQDGFEFAQMGLTLEAK